MIYRYPVLLEQDDDGGFVVSFPDFPEAVTQGENRNDAMIQAIDCLDEVLAGRMNDGEDIPRPARSRAVCVEPSAQIAAKVALYEAFRESGLRRTVFARKLEVAETEVRRMLDPYHPTKLPRIEAALNALGKRMRIEVVQE